VSCFDSELSGVVPKALSSNSVYQKRLYVVEIAYIKFFFITNGLILLLPQLLLRRYLSIIDT